MEWRKNQGKNKSISVTIFADADNAQDHCRDLPAVKCQRETKAPSRQKHLSFLDKPRLRGVNLPAHLWCNSKSVARVLKMEHSWQGARSQIKSATKPVPVLPWDRQNLHSQTDWLGYLWHQTPPTCLHGFASEEHKATSRNPGSAKERKG